MGGAPRGSVRSAGIGLETHRAVEAGAGLALFLLPFLLRYLVDAVDFSTAAIVVFGVLGFAAATLGFAGPRGGGDALGGSHPGFDRILCVAGIVATLAFAFRGELEAALFAGGFALTYGVLITFTRYSSRG